MNFICVGNHAINLDLVTQVTWGVDVITLFFGDASPSAGNFPMPGNASSGGVKQRFEKDEAKALIAYFEKQADLLAP
jgi:hypothetical protein